MEVSLSEERHSLITTGGGRFQDGLTFSLEQKLLTNNSDVSSRSAGALTLGDASVSVCDAGVYGATALSFPHFS